MTVERRPWLGLASFTEAHAAQFFGREAEVGELVRRLSRKGLTVLFGQSGLGKTSILQAGIVPRMREAGFAPVLLRIDYAADAPAPQAQVLAALGWPQDEGLWEQLHRRDRTGPAPLLVFDQFEEVFTLGQADEAGRAKARAFLTELADLVENRVPAALEARLEEDDALFERYDLQRADFRLLISLREDYLAHLEPLKAQMPGITQNRMRIAPMTGEQALQAVCGPGGELVSTDTAEAIVRFVSGAMNLAHAEVEPALLSLILRELNEQRIAKAQAQITPDLLAGSHAAILSDFYERSLADQPSGVRHFIEDQLLTDTGYRENLAEERVKQAFAAAGAAPNALEQLVNRRLLRVEERLDRRRVELTHDTLCQVVVQSRQARHEREQVMAAQAEAEHRGRQVHAARVAVRKARLFALGGFMLATLAIGASVWAWHTRQVAEAARNQAQSLMGFLLDDFYEDLQPVGRTPLVTGLGQRLVSYYDALPESLQGQVTEAQRAHAELRTAMSLITQADLDQAEPLLARSVSRFEALRALGDHSRETLLGLAQAKAFQARVLVNRFKLNDALRVAQQAVELLPTDTREARPAERLAHYRVLMQLLWASEQVRSDDKGTQAGERALAILREGGADQDIRSDDPWTLRLAAAFIDASHWTAESMTEQSGQIQLVEPLVAAAISRAQWLLSQQPGHVNARGDRAELWRIQANLKLQAMDFEGAEQLARQAVAEREQLAREDPKQNRMWINLAGGQYWLADVAMIQGKARTALALYEVPLATVSRLPHIGFNLRALNTYTQELLRAQLDLGEWQAAQRSLEALKRVHQERVDIDPQRIAMKPWTACMNAVWELTLSQWRGDAEAVVDSAARTLEQRMALQDPAQMQGRDRSGAQDCQSRGLELLAERATAHGDWQLAADLLGRSLRMSEDLRHVNAPDEQEQTRLRIWRALALVKLGQITEARSELDQAQRWLDKRLRPGHAHQFLRLMQLAVWQLQATLVPAGEAAALRQQVRAEWTRLPAEMALLHTTRTWLRWFGLPNPS